MPRKELVNKKKMEPWLIWGGGALFAFFALYLQTSVSVMIDPLKADFDIGNIGIGFLASSFFYTYAIMQIPIGAMIDKFGVRRVLAVSVVGTFYSCVLFAYADSYAMLIIARVAMGLFSASAFPCAFCLAAVWFPRSLFPTVAGYTEMLGMFGGAFASNFLSSFILGYGWRTTSLFSGCIAATLAFLAIYTVKDRKTKGMITNFGAFVDVGVHQDGLVHISQLSNSFVSNPADIVKVNQQVKVKVLEVDTKRKRINLSMKK